MRLSSFKTISHARLRCAAVMRPQVDGAMPKGSRAPDAKYSVAASGTMSSRLPGKMLSCSRLRCSTADVFPADGPPVSTSVKTSVCSAGGSASRSLVSAAAMMSV